jgi:hypothetical protein
VKKGTKEGTKEGTHPRLTFERAQQRALAPTIAAAAANYYNAASGRDLFARTIHGQTKLPAAPQISYQRCRPVPIPLQLLEGTRADESPPPTNASYFVMRRVPAHSHEELIQIFVLSSNTQDLWLAHQHETSDNKWR